MPALGERTDAPPAALPLARPRVPSEPAGLALGEVAPPFPPLADRNGERYAFESFDRFPVLVLAFLGNACPAVKACLPELAALQRGYAARGCQVVAINPNNPYLSPTDSEEGMRRLGEEFDLPYPYLKDPGGAVARGYCARNTPHFLLLDAERRLRYRGRMFDSRQPGRAGSRDLEDALVAVVEGRPLLVTETIPLGCSIVW